MHRHDETGSCFHDSARVHYWFVIRVIVCVCVCVCGCGCGCRCRYRYEAGDDSRPEVVAPGDRKGEKQPDQKGAIIKGTQHLFDDKRLRGCNLWRGLNFINLARHSPEGVLRGTLETAEYQRFNFTI